MSVYQILSQDFLIVPKLSVGTPKGEDPLITPDDISKEGIPGDPDCFSESHSHLQAVIKTRSVGVKDCLEEPRLPPP